MGTQAEAEARRRTITVREARPHEDGALGDALARTFWDDPVMSWLMPNERARYHRQKHFYRAEIKATRQRGKVLTTPDLDGAALWLPPHKWRTPWKTIVGQAPGLILAFSTRIGPGLKLLQHMEEIHPKEPHWYLGIIGTDPLRQGSGVGGALIRDVTDRCDREGIGAYLESSKHANVAYYERFGFKVTGEVSAPKGGPTLWPMWRDPQ